MGDSGEITTGDFRQHKIFKHFESELAAFLSEKMGAASTSISEAITESLQRTSEAVCDFETAVFAQQKGSKDRLTGFIRGLTYERLKANEQQAVFDIARPVWEKHLRQLERLETRQRREDSARRERIAQLDAERQEAEDRRRASAAEAEEIPKVRNSFVGQRTSPQDDALAAKRESAERDRARRRQKHQEGEEYLAEAKATLSRKFLEFDFFGPRDDIYVTQADLDKLMSEFVQNWVSEKGLTTVTGTAIQVTDEQALAIGSLSRHTLVTARAGSGKTTVMALRAVFMAEHCGIDPRKHLLLTFNKLAAAELGNRIYGLLMQLNDVKSAQPQRDPIKEKQKRARLLRSAGVPYPEVLTFHSLAYKVVERYRAQNGLAGLTYISDGGDDQDDARGRAIRATLDELMASPARKILRRFLRRHFEQDWIALISAEKLRGIASEIDWQRYPRLTLKGDSVKSRGEKVIADLLYSHGVDYTYEKALSIKGELFVRPDFSITHGSEKPLLIEYLGLMGDPDYDASNDRKRTSLASAGYRTLELNPMDLADVTLLTDKIRMFLLENAKGAINFSALDADELEELIWERGKTNIEALLKNFVARARASSVHGSEIRAYADRLDESVGMEELERDFLRIAVNFLDGYVSFLDANELQDFDGLLHSALGAIDEGTKRIATDESELNLDELGFISVDEYQDFSPGFQGIIDRLVGLSHATVFAVGDDWQSINGFMGAKPEIFSTFGSRMPNSLHLDLLTNHRSSAKIVRLGNLVMEGEGRGALPRADATDGVVEIFDVSVLTSAPHERGQHGTNPRVISAARLMQDRHGATNSGNFILSRMKRNPTDVFLHSAVSDGLGKLKKNVLITYGSDARIQNLGVSSTHSFKGRESPTVIVWDADANRYPFVHPFWFYMRIFGDTLEDILAEEKRLLYVAITRAEQKLYILFDSEMSPFLKNIAAPYRSKIDNYVRDAVIDAHELQLVVSNGFDAKDSLKNGGFTFNSIDKTWAKTVQYSQGLEEAAREIDRRPPDWLVAARREKAKVQLRSQTETIDI